MAGELITSFRPEVQARILSNQDKYNPDKNEYIDEKEIGVLLKEFGTTNVMELQVPKGIGRQISEYVFPKVDVYPAQGEGYRAVYTDGDEIFITEENAQECIKYSDTGNGAAVGGVILSGATAILAIGSLAAGGSAVSETNGLSFMKQARLFTKKAAPWALLAGGLAFLAKKCFNAEKNEMTIKAKLNMLQKDAEIQAQRRKQEEALRAQQEAMQQAELEYRERMHTATQGVDNRLQSAEQRARNINRELKEAQSTIAPADTIAN